MKRICHMTSAHASNDIRIMKKECVTLADAGYEVYLVAKGESGQYKGVKIEGIGTVTGGRIHRFLHITKQVYDRALELNADIYHFHDPELLPYALKLKRRGKKVIYDSHEYTREQIRVKAYIPRSIRRLVAAIFASYEDFIIGKLDAVIFPTRYKGKDPFENAKRLVYVNNYPRLEERNIYTNNVPSEKEMAVCYVGGLSYERGICHLVQACHLAEVKLILAGRFSSLEFQHKLMGLPEYSCVEYLGEVERQQVYEIYNRCFIGANVLLNVGQYYNGENLSTKVYEYMAMKMPVVISDSPYNKSLIEKYRFGLTVNPEEPQEIADAICYLLSHKEEADEMGERGAKLVKEQFSWEHEGEALLQLYQQL